jgi:L-malate glycosyltransferase
MIVANIPGALHQIIPVLDPGDAASSHTLIAQKVLRRMGLASDIFAETCNVPGGAKPLADYAGEPVVYQLAIGSVAADRIMELRPALAVNSHNLTPTSFFEQWDPGLIHGTAWGQRQLRSLAKVADLGFGVSRFNTAELDAAGFRHTATAPFLFDPSRLQTDIDPAEVDRLRSTATGAQWLFVGRLVPNKAQHEIIRAFALYRSTIDPGARLHLVGGASSPRYETALRAYVTKLGLDGAAVLTGPVAAPVLAAHYAAADVFVCLSRHEGFCVPLVEAMHRRVPIVAAANAAIPETAGDAAVLLTAPSAADVAVAVERVVSDATLRDALVAAGERRIAGALSLAAAEDAFERVIGDWLAP